METDTVCPVCWESVHSDKPVGITTGCGHIWHQECYQSWQREGEYLFYESSGASSSASSAPIKLNSHVNCLICQQPTQSFVDLFIRLPASKPNYKDLVAKIEHEFHTVSRRVQLSLEKEIARRDFEQTWLQEERQISCAAKLRAHDRHNKAVKGLERNLEELKIQYDQKMRSMEERRGHQNRSCTNHEDGAVQLNNSQMVTQMDEILDEEVGATMLSQGEAAIGLDIILPSNEADSDVRSLILEDLEINRNEIELSPTVNAGISVEVQSTVNTTNQFSPSESQTFDAHGFPVPPTTSRALATEGSVTQPPVESEDRTLARPLLAGNMDTITRWITIQQKTYNDSATDLRSTSESAIKTAAASSAAAPTSPNSRTDGEHTLTPARVAKKRTSAQHGVSPRSRRALKDAIFHPEVQKVAAESPSRQLTNRGRSRRSIMKDEIFLPMHDEQSCSIDTEEGAPTEPKNALRTATSVSVTRDPKSITKALKKQSTEEADTLQNRKELGNVGGEIEDNENDLPKMPPSHAATVIAAAATSFSAEYETQRLQAETVYYQHQAELVEWELHQAEMELEQEEDDIREQERRISLERSRLEESFSFIRCRVEETKQEARDRQKVTLLEEKFIKYKIARCKEEERFEQELDHLRMDEVNIQEREESEKQRQEKEKGRLKKKLNQLVKVMNKLENAKQLAKAAEEESSASQSQETCVVCFEPLVHDDAELGVCVPCGHTFHSACFSGWEKSKRKRRANVPCPMCNVDASLCVTIRMNRPGSSMYCSNSSLSKHFQKEEDRWQRRRLTYMRLYGETSS